MFLCTQYYNHLFKKFFGSDKNLLHEILQIKARDFDFLLLFILLLFGLISEVISEMVIIDEGKLKF